MVEQCLAELPESLADRARAVPVVFASVPPDEPGLDDDLLGLFVGDAVFASGESLDPTVTRIELYLENIWIFCERNPSLFVEEVRITFLHELGHYFGWDEDDLAERGLD